MNTITHQPISVGALLTTMCAATTGGLFTAARARTQSSIRINDQWRIGFVWRDGETWDIEIVEYH
jgi:hypothetical protein